MQCERYTEKITRMHKLPEVRQSSEGIEQQPLRAGITCSFLLRAAMPQTDLTVRGKKMLSHDNAKIQDRKFILWARYHPDFLREVLIPEIEANSLQYHVAPQLADHFIKCRHMKNSMYFFHGFAYALLKHSKPVSTPNVK